MGKTFNSIKVNSTVYSYDGKEFKLFTAFEVKKYKNDYRNLVEIKLNNGDIISTEGRQNFVYKDNDYDSKVVYLTNKDLSDKPFLKFYFNK